MPTVDQVGLVSIFSSAQVSSPSVIGQQWAPHEDRWVLSRALKQGLGDTGWEESHPKWPLVSSNHDHALLELGKVHVPEARSRRVGRSLTGASRRGNERQTAG